MIPPLPKGYVCVRSPRPPRLDGRLEGPEWAMAHWTDDFVDISTTVKPRFRTRAKMLWDEHALYIGAEMEEPHVWATLTERDSVIFHDNDFEVFLDPDGDHADYLELEVNAFGTPWDLRLAFPYRAGGSELPYKIEGLKVGVHVRGTLNDPSDKDLGWSVTMAWPWEDLRAWCKGHCPPQAGEVWRINFSRVQWKHDVVEGRYVRRPGPEDNWVWSPQGVIDMHRPWMWGRLQFAETIVPLRDDPDWSDRMALVAAWESRGHSVPEGVVVSGEGPSWSAKRGAWRIDEHSRLFSLSTR